MQNIIWSAEAKFDYRQNIDYLKRKWSLKEVRNFVELTKKILSNISTKTIKPPLYGYKDYMYILICKQITLFYRINKNEQFELIKVLE